MVSILTKECPNDECAVVTFTYASCEPPICPGCHICAECGEEEQYHTDQCPEGCDYCALYGECEREEKDNVGEFEYCEDFERAKL